MKKTESKYRVTDLTNQRRCKSFVNTILTMLGIYIAFFVMILAEGVDDVFDMFVDVQATPAGMYVNALAVISMTYSKFSTMDLIRVSTYFLSVFALFVVINIFAQSLYVVNPELWSAWDCFRSPMVTVALQVILMWSIYLLASQKEVEYKKNKIR